MNHLSNPRWVALIVFGIFCTIQLKAATVYQTVYINRGQMMAVDSTYIPYFAFNSTPIFQTENARIIANSNDIIELTIFNTDTIAHGFDIKGYTGVSTVIAANSSQLVTFTFTSPGAHIYFDPSFSEAYSYMGLSGVIAIKNPSVSSTDFFWNMKEHQKSFNEALNVGIAVDWSMYYPDYFTINGRSNPFINTDTTARVTGNIGDTIHIYMVNTGRSLHSIHFHGYHCTILNSSKSPSHIGRSKDTFPIHSMETMILELVPDQLGEYPVHDHNLVAVSGANIYPNGMFLTILID